jgi:hypothetical protein
MRENFMYGFDEGEWRMPLSTLHLPGAVSGQVEQIDIIDKGPLLNLVFSCVSINLILKGGLYGTCIYQQKVLLRYRPSR